MITTAATPWTAQFNDAASTIVMDAQGNMIGVLGDYRNAELVLEAINSGKRVEELESKIKDLESEIEGLEKIDADRDKEMEFLEKKNHELVEKITLQKAGAK